MDDRLYKVEQQKQQALNQSNNMYQGLLNDNQALYDKQNAYANEQEVIQNNILDKQLANQRTEIERQKEIANQNFQTESKRAKNDYTAFINPYGVQAESQASRGLANSGLAETTKLGGWNTYQNRLANANKVMQDAFTQYDKDLNEAILNNDVQKAQNALNKLQMQLEYSQSYYNNKSSISQNQLSNNQNLDSDYFNRYQTEYGNIQAEKAAEEARRQWEAEFAEQQRQYNENLAYQREQSRIAQEQWQKEYELSKKKVSSSSGRSGSKSSKKSGSSYALSDGSSSKGSNTYSANMSPNLSTKEYKWYSQNFAENMTDSQLAKAIESGIKNGKLKESDVKNIYKAYGLK